MYLTFHQARIARDPNAPRTERAEALRKMSIASTFSVTVVVAAFATVTPPQVAVYLLWLAPLWAVIAGIAYLTARPLVALEIWRRSNSVLAQFQPTSLKSHLRTVCEQLRSEYERGSVSRTEALKSPSTDLWYSNKTGRILLGAVVGSALIFAIGLNLMLENDKPREYFKNWSALYGISLVFSIGGPLGVTWLTTAAITGQPRLRYTLQRVRGCVGMGTSFGLLLAIASFFYIHMSPTEPGARINMQPAIPYSIQTFLVCATLGTVAGLTVGMFAVTVESALLLGNRYLAVAFSVTASTVSTYAVSKAYPPKQLLTDLIDGVTAGITPIRIDAIAEETDWKTILASAKQYAVQDMMSSAGATWLVGSSVAIYGFAMLGRWRISLAPDATDKQAASPSPSTAIEVPPRRSSLADNATNEVKHCESQEAPEA